MKKEGCGKTYKSGKEYFTCGFSGHPLCRNCKSKNIIKEFEEVGQANFGSKGMK